MGSLGYVVIVISTAGVVVTVFGIAEVIVTVVGEFFVLFVPHLYAKSQKCSWDGFKDQSVTYIH